MVLGSFSRSNLKLSCRDVSSPPGKTVEFANELDGADDMTDFLYKLWSQEDGQDIAEYAVMLAVILVLVVGTIRLIGGSANNVFSATASAIGQ
jgi:Flp pilus assembly pilin Flp